MSPAPVSLQTEERISLLFPYDWQRAVVRTILSDQCGRNLPFMKDANEAALERLHFAALKLSKGNLDKLRGAVALAQQDWRDLLMAADFGQVGAHKSWWPERLSKLPRRGRIKPTSYASSISETHWHIYGVQKRLID